MIGRAPVNIKTLQESVENESSNNSLANRINELREKSQYSSFQEREVNCVIKNKDGEEFEIEKIEDSNDPKLKDVILLLKETFGKEEVDSDEVLMAAIDGKSAWGTLRDKYNIVTICDKEKNLMATCVGSVLNKNISETSLIDGMFYYVAYIATNPSIKKSGLAREAYISSLIDAEKIAQDNNNKLNFSVGECSSSSEHFWNNVGEKRIYIKKDMEYKELPYVLPAITFNLETGDPAVNNVAIPLHMMLDSFSDEKITTKTIKNIYEIIFASQKKPKEAFTSDEAYEKYRQYIVDIKKRFADFLESEGEIAFLDAKEEEQLKKDGYIVSENK